ncbi:exosporium glycoprotein BclB-related protein [Bacillus cereus]|uniref:exosporium glycoprotein BclB-related protein n=1 Tax=Bacillus cereus TaxID=1396 RepID=UPI000BFD84DE|nr:exosporium glycoprotein BclB-related protein [Bacillus cereus]PGY11402.1 collagen-like repeat preface domain-containing protein [Bacillus cereus]
MKHNDCSDNNHCDSIIITGGCCEPKVVCPSNSQLNELINLLNALIIAIPTFFATPNAANKLILINLFNQLLDLLNLLLPTTEGDYLKQLVQSILNELQSPNTDLGQLAVLLQQFYSALADFFFSIQTCFAPSTLRLLFNLLTQLISLTPIPPGATGATGGGAIIPYASGTTPAVLVNLVAGTIGTGTLLGFGFSQPGISLLGGGDITLAAGIGDYAFVAPRAGTITSLAGFFSVLAGVSLGTTQVQMQILIASAASNTFSPVGAPLLLLPTFVGIVVGATASGIEPLNIPVAAGDKILVYVSLTGASPIATIDGFASAGINIV